MDLSEAKAQLAAARQTLLLKGAPIEGTAAGHLLLALEELTRQLEQQFGSVTQGPPVVRHKGIRRNADW